MDKFHLLAGVVSWKYRRVNLAKWLARNEVSERGGCVQMLERVEAFMVVLVHSRISGKGWFPCFLRYLLIIFLQNTHAGFFTSYVSFIHFIVGSSYECIDSSVGAGMLQ